MSAPTQDLSVPVYDSIPESWEQGREFLTEQFKRHANNINARAGAYYLLNQNPSGKLLYSTVATTTGTYRTIFRKLVDFGALPNTATKSVAHDISIVDANFTPLKIEGYAYDPVAFIALPLPFSSPTLNENIKMNMDATNINITTAIDYSAYTRTIIILEYSGEI